MGEELRIEITKNGPYAVFGAPLLRMRKRRDAEGRTSWERRGGVSADPAYDLCRCGRSADKPFCDGSHKQGFDGTESSDRAPTASRRKEYRGETIVLTDDKGLCEHAGLCVQGHTNAWKMVSRAGDPAVSADLETMVASCPSGRLALQDPSGAPLEPELPAEVAIVDDGPLWVRGGISIRSADGEAYEVRNRVTLCRCGASKNKPFCDGSHAEIGFRDA